MDNGRVTTKYDRRRKLTEKQKDEIRALYREHGTRTLKGVRGEGMSQRALAKLYGVSRRLIVFVLHPNREKIQKNRVKEEKRWNKYYTTESRREYMRRHRAHKKKLFEEGKLQIK